MCRDCGAPATRSGLCGTCLAIAGWQAERAAWIARRHSCDRPAAIAWAAQALADPRMVVLDSETTGLGDDARLVELAVLDRHARPLLDTLIDPGVPIPAEATAVHGITDAMVCGAPDFGAVLPALEQALEGARLVIYNRRFDEGVIGGELARHHGLGADDRADLGEWWAARGITVECAMCHAADYRGQWDDQREGWRNPKLANPDPGAHRAASDCRALLGLLEAMAAERL